MLLPRVIILGTNHCTFFASINKFHTSFVTHLHQGWRKQKGLTVNPNRNGPLLNGPEFSFKDNRPTPYGINQLQRIQRHQNYVRKILQLTKEVDSAVERHANLLKQKEIETQKILSNKLQPKGNQLVTSK